MNILINKGFSHTKYINTILITKIFYVNVFTEN